MNRALAAVVVSAGLVLVACGADKSPDRAAGTPTTASTATTATTTVTTPTTSPTTAAVPSSTQAVTTARAVTSTTKVFVATTRTTADRPATTTTLGGVQPVGDVSPAQSGGMIFRSSKTCGMCAGPAFSGWDFVILEGGRAIVASQPDG